LFFLENNANSDIPSSPTAWTGVTGPSLNADFATWQLGRYRHALEKREIAQINSVPETVLESSQHSIYASDTTSTVKKPTGRERIRSKVSEGIQKLRQRI
jgi:hypothetical protein